MKLLFLVATDHYFCSHRLHLGKAACSAGFEVAVATRIVPKPINHPAKSRNPIEDAGITVFPLKYFTRASLNPIRQFFSLWELYKIYKTFKPDIVHHVAMKPVIFGSLVARWCKVPKVINALGGLGYLFTEPSPGASPHPLPQAGEGKQGIKKSLLRYIASHLLRFVFATPHSTLILQNKDDLDTLINTHIVNAKQVVIIPGAGVDLTVFSVTPMPSESPIIITCITRMLWDKGIGELVEAAKLINTLLKEKNGAKIILYGMPDPENPASLDLKTLRAWNDSGIILWKGHCDNVAHAYSNSHIAVLPSYREGMPKSLLEAASCGRPIVTTDVPGCREIVAHGENGLLVPAQDPNALAKALMQLIENKELRMQMGQKGRLRVETYFSDTIIQQKTLNLYTLTLRNYIFI